MSLLNFPYQSSEFGVPLPGHFSPNMFTIAAFDNSDHSDRNTLSGKSSTHDTVTTIFQEMPVEVTLKEIKSLSKLPCQELSHFVSNKTFNILPSFVVDEDVYESKDKIQSSQNTEFIISCVKGTVEQSEITLPSWAGIRALLSSSNVPLMQVAFVPFLPYPVTERTMLNFIKVLQQLKQQSFPDSCDE